MIKILKILDAFLENLFKAYMQMLMAPTAHVFIAIFGIITAILLPNMKKQPQYFYVTLTVLIVFLVIFHVGLFYYSSRKKKKNENPKDQTKFVKQIG